MTNMHAALPGYLGSVRVDLYRITHALQGSRSITSQHQITELQRYRQRHDASGAQTEVPPQCLFMFVETSEFDLTCFGPIGENVDIKQQQNSEPPARVAFSTAERKLDTGSVSTRR